ncbi:MAG: AmmeMemoRadiSam system protein B [Methanomicrobiales archaeon]|nr:AmmeMemoRadiSam system protein B [Methanomicrobiales archaeon]MDI6875407.1 AmmeMemoRadiSam system protein B [Methanomicrobiales archaeon]
MKTRPSSVAGMFYPGEPRHLEQLLARFFAGGEPGIDARGIVAPHAGYVYSGEVAGCAFRALRPDFGGTFVVIGPSHRGYLSSASAIPWETPLGIVDIDRELVEAIGIGVDEVSHRQEHSLETQMPFIKYRFPRARIAPIMMGDQDLESALGVAEDILQGIRQTERDVRIVASSDFSHYVPHETAKRNDLYAIDALKTLDIPAFYERISIREVTACGYGPIAAMCTVARELGATRADLLKYATSGDVTGDFASVVGYAAIAVV